MTSAPDLIWAARVCYLEAEFRLVECAVLLWIGRKRAAGGDWLAALRAYSVLERRESRRARAARALPAGDLEGAPATFNDRWRALRDLVERFAAGEVADPCPRARGWGGSMDPVQPGQVPIRCSVRTVNWLYALGGAK